MKTLRRLTLFLLLIRLFSYAEVTFAVPAEQNSPVNTGRATLSFDQVKAAADRGDADAQYALGYMFYYGKGVPKNPIEAKNWISKAARQNQTQAIRALALITRQPVAAVKHTEPVTVEKEAHSTVNQADSVVSNKARATVTPSPAKETDSHEALSATVTESVSGVYTLQLLGASHKEPISKLIEEHHLGSDAKIQHTQLHNKDWYMLTYGQYKTITEAKAAAKRFETELKIQPWVKRLR